MNGDKTLVYDLYTDGACQPNPGKGGWAFIVVLDNEVVYQNQGFVEIATSSRMELMAVLEGLKLFKEKFWTENEFLRVYSDSRYLVDGINEWIDGWSKKGWLKTDGSPVLNLDLWQVLLKLKQELKPYCIHIHGHSGHAQNEFVDQLAVAAIYDNTKV